MRIAKACIWFTLIAGLLNVFGVINIPLLIILAPTLIVTILGFLYAIIVIGIAYLAYCIKRL